MTTKLNLTIEESVAAKIKLYAEKQKTSVSRIAEEYFAKLVSDKKTTGKSFVEKYAGIISDIKIEDIDKERDNYLKEKYGI
ncbi:DUF6364 family protein [Niabella drilacis]|uniref:Ribbon-helix-helix protein, copG family n=1 Tax=Niabella drilacis (strain DSM 25811 / CCM 8410 / CCUG 62505 / LMG 26954 / E90) TaxID=1285928 RepID=A0A1G6SZN9_NIADE|nr:DUF6364 family protein [Niabella drilacis]SDD22181.1 hypothetical protein SAMN04487894_10733 [Niabella drilacis]